MRHVVILQALLGYVIHEYSTGFSHDADRVFVIGGADIVSLQQFNRKKKGELSVMLQHAAVRVPIFRRIHTHSDTDPALVPCAVLLSPPLLLHLLMLYE